MASVEVNQMLAVVAAACDDKKAEDIRILALDPTESGLTDYFLICTGSNDRQTVAITDEIEIRLKREFGNYPNSVEGRRQGEWILMDYVDFIVHVFLPEKRAYYGLERLRPSATTLSVADLNSEIKAAITAQRTRKSAKAASESPSTKTLSAVKKDGDAGLRIAAAATSTSTKAPSKAKNSAPPKAAKKASSVVKDGSAKSAVKAPAKTIAKGSGKSAAKVSAKPAPVKTSAKAASAKKGVSSRRSS